ncbi:MAG TPA: ornithine carbamoyltransferase [Smithellaceae bacterium]|jgi:ornithine carbamoyltransferase|nr:ornithine carbamoyltransferase [Syntrophaceae bacterium]HOD63871.1 ornithine carbamoyltransferase [Smithellaceae bacterium]MBP8664990.1 ornithine carbamoyltransferase [Syntrophaceae bacterium]MBP9650038.1 ornithine carbamoyltransferase [Syntrophaceae bacterium]HOE23609.1 ornithine carbamoyltransferase [Smithellaceae bacterium]
MKKDLLSFAGMQPPDFEEILRRTARLKKMLKEGRKHASLAGKTLGMIFDKSSTRTRISFEVGMYQLGGIALFLNSRDTQIGRGETLADSARMMSCYLDGIMIRTFAQESVEELARYATIPVINGLTDLLHPCQILADLFTIQEKKGSYEGVRVAYIGDGNNVANSWIEAATHLPFELALACPEGYDPDSRLMKESRKDGRDRVRLCRDPFEAAAGADVLYTDVWTSMGQEAESQERKKIFANYQINGKLLGVAKKDAIVMHCLPAHRGEEITAEVIDGPQSVVIDEAENRLHAQKAVLEILL